MGPSIKYVTLEGEVVREGVTVCDRERGPRACEVILFNFFIDMKLKLKVMFSLML